jgi:DNA-binding LytR/AlgR family response regulator
MEKNTASVHRNKYHPDILIFLVAIPIISAINFHLTYSNIQLNSFFLGRFLIDTGQGYVAWWLVRMEIIYLDHKIPYSAKPLMRIIIQTILTTFTGLFFIAASTEILSLIIKSERAPTDFYTTDLLIISIWFLVINGFYIGMYFYKHWEEKISESKVSNPDSTGIPVKTGNQNLLIRFEEISLFVVEIEYVQLLDLAGRKYLLDSSLDKMEKKIPCADFFRLNRQVLAHRQVIKGFKRIENGKLLIQLNTAFDFSHDLTVSRTKAASFRAWFLPQ